MGPHQQEKEVFEDGGKRSSKAAAAGADAVWYLGCATGIAAAAILPFLIVPWLPRHKWGSLPYMNTPRKKLAKLFDEMLPRHVNTQQQLQLQLQPSRQGPPPLRFIDLGSGMGEAVIEARKRGFEARGVELNPTLFLLSSASALRQLGPRAFWQEPRLAFRCGNMFVVDLQSYDVVMMFGVAPLMARLTHKLQREAKDGAVVVLYRFKLELPPEGQQQKAGGDVEIRLVEAAEELSIYTVHRNKEAK
jgi:hypothetical protein